MASARLAMDIGADVLLILTAVDTVFTDYGRPAQKPLRLVTTSKLETLVKEGQFGSGSMEPKVLASLKFLKSTPAGRHRKVIITAPEKTLDALAGKTGTKIILG
jgi:carbamate kinase